MQISNKFFSALALSALLPGTLMLAFAPVDAQAQSAKTTEKKPADAKPGKDKNKKDVKAASTTTAAPAAGAAATSPAQPATDAKTDAKKAETPPPPVNFQAGDVWNVDIFKREDHKVLVIQDRVYTKARKVEIGFDVGKTSATPFFNVYSYGLHMDYHFTEYSGLEAFYTHSSSSETADKRQLDNYLSVNGFNSTKEYKKPTDFLGIAYLWSPIYGKFAFFRSRIIYFDFYGSAGVSMLRLTTNIPASRQGKDQNLVGSLLSVGMRAFINNHWSVRIDMRNNIYRADYAPITHAISGAVLAPGTTVTRTNWQFTTGISYLFGFGR